MLVTEITLFIILSLSLQTGAIPVVHPKPGCPSTDFTVLGPDLCYLTPKLGSTGTRKFLEDCEGLGDISSAMPLTSSYQHRCPLVSAQMHHVVVYQVGGLGN